MNIRTPGEEVVDYEKLNKNQSQKDFELDADRGARVFYGKCANCHTVSRYRHHKKGPSLFGVVHRKAGDIVGYKFSKALKNSNITWNFKNFDKYLIDPQHFVPGTKMNYVAAIPMRYQQRYMVFQFLKKHSPENAQFLNDEPPETDEME